MSGWSRVRHLFEDTVAARRRALMRERRAARARESLEAWYETAERELMSALAEALQARATELGKRGVTVSVRVPVPSLRLVSTRAGGFRRVVQVVFLGEEVMAYSTRSAPGPLMVHWARVFRSNLRRPPRLLSVPGFRVRRGVEGQMVLDAVGPAASTTPLTVQEVACGLLSILVEQAAVRRYRLPLPR